MGQNSQLDFYITSREAEVTPGVIVGSTRKQVLCRSAVLSHQMAELVSRINLGDGQVHGVRPGSRGGSMAIESELRYEANEDLWEDAFRNTFTADQSATGLSLTYDPAGTQESGDTGPIISVASGTPFSGWTAGVVETVGASNSDNDLPKRVLHVHSNGNQLDLDPAWVAGTAGSIGAPLISEGPTASCAVYMGRVLQNGGIENIVNCNFEGFFQDLAVSDSFINIVGCRSSGFGINYSGNDYVGTRFGYEGLDISSVYTTSVGSSTTAPSGTQYASQQGLDDADYVVVNGTIELAAADVLRTLEITADGSANIQDDTIGKRGRASITNGDLMVSAAMSAYYDHTQVKALLDLAYAGTPVGLSVRTSDPDGNWIWVTIHSAMLTSDGSYGGEKGNQQDGTSFKATAQAELSSASDQKTITL